MHEENGLSIWFFVGGMLTIYGVIVLIANIPGLSASQNPHLVLQQLHAGVWWGIILALLGALFLFLHWPGKHSILDDKDQHMV